MSKRESFQITELSTVVRAVAANGPYPGTAVIDCTITPASVGAATVAEQTFTVGGLRTTDRVVAMSNNTGNATGVVGARVSASNTLAVKFVNPTAGALTPGAGAYTFLVIRGGESGGY